MRLLREPIFFLFYCIIEAKITTKSVKNDNSMDFAMKSPFGFRNKMRIKTNGNCFMHQKKMKKKQTMCCATNFCIDDVQNYRK